MSRKFDRRQKRLRGFTLVELLVVIAIIGILIALLLPAVQSAREAARRMTCSNNNKNIGEAMHLHCDAKGYLPPGFYWPEGLTGDDGAAESTWVTHTLPYFEQGIVHDDIDWDRGFGQTWDPTGPNFAVLRTKLPVMLCPSDQEIPVLTRGGLPCFAHGNYVANDGLGPMTEKTYKDLSNNNRVKGVFYCNSNTKIRDFTDGTTQTALVSEIILTPGDASLNEMLHDFRGVMHYPEGCHYHHNHTPNSDIPDQIRVSYCNDNPDAPCEGTYSNSGDRSLILTARSRHPGGVNLLLADGSVRFVEESIDIDIWHAVATPSATGDEILITDF